MGSVIREVPGLSSLEAFRWSSQFLDQHFTQVPQAARYRTDSQMLHLSSLNSCTLVPCSNLNRASTFQGTSSIFVENFRHIDASSCKHDIHAITPREDVDCYQCRSCITIESKPFPDVRHTARARVLASEAQVSACCNGCRGD